MFGIGVEREPGQDPWTMVQVACGNADESRDVNESLGEGSLPFLTAINFGCFMQMKPTEALPHHGIGSLLGSGSGRGFRGLGVFGGEGPGTVVGPRGLATDLSSSPGVLFGPRGGPGPIPKGREALVSETGRSSFSGIRLAKGGDFPVSAFPRGDRPAIGAVTPEREMKQAAVDSIDALIGAERFS
jgi:hypothetical protein